MIQEKKPSKTKLKGYNTAEQQGEARNISF